MLDPTGPLNKTQPEDLIENTCCRLVLKGTSTHIVLFFIVTLFPTQGVLCVLDMSLKHFQKLWHFIREPFIYYSTSTFRNPPNTVDSEIY